MPEPITVACEGPTDEAVLRRVLFDTGFAVSREFGRKGKNDLDRKLGAYNSAARFSRWLVLRDLNGDESCAPALIKRLLPRPAEKMRLHVAIHALESWLMADAEAFGDFFGVPAHAIPSLPDGVDRPKLEVINLARRSRKKTVREALLPEPGSTANVGAGYTVYITEFASGPWRPRVAATRSPSLDRLLRYLDSVKKGG